MTVKELIAELRKFDPKAEVTVASPPSKRMQVSPIGSVVMNGGPSLQTQFFEEYIERCDARGARKRAAAAKHINEPYAGGHQLQADGSWKFEGGGA